MDKALSSILTFLADSIRIVTKLEFKLNRFLDGILQMKKGKLSHDIIPFTTLKENIHKVSETIYQRFPQLHLVQHDPTFYLQSELFLFRRHHNKFYITIFFPVSVYQNLFQLYQIKTIPVPLNASSQHVSQLLDLPEILAINKVDDVYTTLSQSDLNNCKGTAVKLCHLVLPNHHTNHMTCTLALFLDDIQAIHQMCDFRFIHTGLKSQIMEIKPSLFLLSNTTNVTLQCQHQEHQLITYKLSLLSSTPPLPLFSYVQDLLYSSKA